MKRNPHAIIFDFETYQDKTKASNLTRDLSYESEHVPISVSIADTLTYLFIFFFFLKLRRE